MTNTQALTKAKKLYGKSHYVRAGESFSSPDRRDKGRAAYQAARTEIEAIEVAIKKRLSELEWYQELRSRQRALRKVSDNGQGSALYYRFTVGKSWIVAPLDNIVKLIKENGRNDGA